MAPRDSMVDKFLIILPFWNGDKSQMCELAKLIADFEPNHSTVADVLFVARFDTKHDPKTAQYVSRKFNIHLHTSMRQGTGWPMGCNSLWFGSMEWCFRMIAARKVPHYRAIINMEADCAPLDPNWLRVLKDQWSAVSRTRPVAIAGDIIHLPGGWEHVNANAVVSGDLKFLRWMVTIAGGHEKNAGWDYYLANDLRRWGWAKLPGIRSCWGTSTLTEQDFHKHRAEGVVMLHGVKDGSAKVLSRKSFLT